MPTYLRVQPMTAEEHQVIAKLARSQTASARLVQRAKILPLGSERQTVPQRARELGLTENTVRKWFKRFDDQGLAG